MSSHTGRLLLCTQDPFLSPNKSLLEDELAAVDFLGAPLRGRDDAFLVGSQFLQLVTFAGCSVQIELSPTGDAPFCHILITGPFDRPRFLSGRNTRPPRCAACRSPLKDWRESLTAWEAERVMEIPCPTCGHARPPWAYDWKEKAGFGRLFVQVEEIFPGEATPTPALMALLERISGSRWQVFYVQNA